MRYVPCSKLPEVPYPTVPEYCGTSRPVPTPMVRAFVLSRQEDEHNMQNLLQKREQCDRTCYTHILSVTSKHVIQNYLDLGANCEISILNPKT